MDTCLHNVQIKTMSSTVPTWESVFCAASLTGVKMLQSEGQKSVSHKKIGFDQNDHPSYRTSPNKDLVP